MNWLHKTRILLVDDNTTMRTIVARVLDGAGAPAPEQAPNGRLALAATFRRRFDLVITDYLMPEMDGATFTRHVRTDPNSPTPKLPIVMMTSYADPVRVAQARDAGVSELLAKPLSIGGLLGRIEAAVRRPRPFVQSPNYYGPDRRRRADPAYVGPQRRSGRPPRTRRRPAAEAFDLDSL